MRPLTLSRVIRICLLLLLILFAVVLLALRLGAVPFSLADLGQNLWWLASGRPEKVSTDFRLIMVDIRLPRILLGILVGAALSVAGASFQALLRNPLADPYVLGVSNGAALGVLVALLVAPRLAAANAAGRLPGRDRHHCRRLLSGPARRASSTAARSFLPGSSRRRSFRPSSCS